MSDTATLASPWIPLGHCLFELPLGTRPGMRVPARLVADAALLDQVGWGAVEQLLNVATLPGVERAVYAMPDVHEGYGFPVGGVAAMRLGDGVISPGGIGYDINCGVRLLTSDLDRAAVGERLGPLVHDLGRSIPSGGWANPRLQLDAAALHAVLREGSAWALGRGLATPEDLAHTEAGGRLPGADPDLVSARAHERGHDQLGTIGSGNHFVELEVVEQVHDPAAAAVYGLRRGQLCVLIHTGSRGLGHQVCGDHVALMGQAMARYGISIPDPQLACAPIAAAEGRAYLGAMEAAANFAFANRQVITAAARQVFRHAFGEAGALHLLYDVAHNMARIESHGGRQLCVHRKGATRAFGPSHPETPVAHRAAGQAVFIPGSMGTASYVLAGTDAALLTSFGSTCHGAGRARSRSAARRAKAGHAVRRELEARGIRVHCASNLGLAEEAPEAYKDIDRVVEVVEAAGLARRVARLVPVGVVKG